MKTLFMLVLLLAGTLLTFPACNTKKDDGASQDTPAGTEQQATSPVTEAKEPHYKCATAGCTGSGPSASPCPACGNELLHNQAFHDQAPMLTPNNQIQVDPQTGGITPQTDPVPPPAQNAAGVFHFSCPNGHEGGSGTAGTCSKCGTAFTHNPAYHN